MSRESSMLPKAAAEAAAMVYDGLVVLQSVANWAKAAEGLDQAPETLLSLHETLTELAPSIADGSVKFAGQALSNQEIRDRVLRLSGVLQGVIGTRLEILALAQEILVAASANGNVPVAMTREDEELIERLVNVKDDACHRLAALITSAYEDPTHTLAAIDEIRASLRDANAAFETVEDLLVAARRVAHSLLQLHTG